MIITIDGPAGSGKSTIAKLLARRLSINYLNTGAMYRAVTLYLLEKHISIDDEASIAEALNDLSIDFIDGNIYLNGKNVSERIKELDVEKNVSKVSSLKSVREKMVFLQRIIGSKMDIVVEGRDTGTVVFPDADYKFYLDASIEERAQRRYNELKAMGIKELNLSLLQKEIEKRDFQDRNRKLSPLRIPANATVIDSTNLSIEDVVKKVISYIESKS
ncbi:MAG: (d)CMP kinase [Brevinematia bacterium]